MRFSQFWFTRMIRGGDGTPRHLFLNCPHVKRMMGITKVIGTYKLSPNSQVLNLIRCKWCRSFYLDLLVEDPEMPTEVVEAMALARKRTEETTPP